MSPSVPVAISAIELLEDATSQSNEYHPPRRRSRGELCKSGFPERWTEAMPALPAIRAAGLPRTAVPVRWAVRGGAGPGVQWSACPALLFLFAGRCVGRRGLRLLASAPGRGLLRLRRGCAPDAASGRQLREVLLQVWDVLHGRGSQRSAAAGGCRAPSGLRAYVARIPSIRDGPWQKRLRRRCTKHEVGGRQAYRRLTAGERQLNSR